jgi:hypothetical protein
MKKHKGMSQPLPLAQRLQIQREAELKTLERNNTELCMKLYYRAGGVALNRAFGFGEKKILEFQRALEQVMAEVKEEKVGVDFEYAYDTLDRAYTQIVKSEA